MDDIFNLNPNISALLASLIGIALTDDLTSNEQSMIGNWLMLLGQTLVTTAASQMLIEKRITGGIININDKCVKKKYYPIIYDIDKIREIIKETMPEESGLCIDVLQKCICKMQNEIDILKRK